MPLAPPMEMKSRKRARRVTSLFHKLTKELTEAESAKEYEKVELLKKKIEDMGGREEYQRASQLSTKFHSTSKWVLKILREKGWQKGIGEEKVPVELLEVGAINTELIDAAKRTNRILSKEIDGVRHYHNIPLYNIRVRAIDLNSMHSDIEEQDFLTMPVGHTSGTYDVIVCSMVLNCVPNARQRGTFLSLLYKQVKSGGLVFFTIPKLCISQSKYTNEKLIDEILQEGVGFTIESKKDTPKVKFWVLKRSVDENVYHGSNVWKHRWEIQKVINHGKKFRNEFSITLNKDEVRARK